MEMSNTEYEVSHIHQIGIIGKGKMGKEIFNQFLDYDYKIILICRKKEDIAVEEEKLEKTLKKKLRRGYINEETYEEKKKSILITDDLKELKESNIVIECIYEDVEIKKKMFHEIENIVGEECILATNTSSIPLKDIFGECKNKDRCLGMHFFYPVKVIETVEINKTSNTALKYVSLVKRVLEDISKKPLELDEEYNMAINKILALLMAKALRIYQDKYLTMREIDNIFKSNILRQGVFEIINSIGMNTVLESFNNFNTERYDGLYTDIINELNQVSKQIPDSENRNNIFEYENIHPLEKRTLDELKFEEYKKSIIKNLVRDLSAEIEFFEDKVSDSNIEDSIVEVLDLKEEFISILKTKGKER